MEKEIYIKLPNEIEKYMLENEIELTKCLADENIEGVFKEKCINPNEKDSRTKDLLPVIIGSGISISVVLLAVNKLVQTIQTKPYMVWIKRYDSKGRPIEKPVLIEPNKYKNETYFKTQFSENEKICIEFGAKDK